MQAAIGWFYRCVLSNVCAGVCCLQKLAATALWVAAKLEEVRVVREHPRKLLEMVMVAVDRSITRRETPEGRKLVVLDTHSKVGVATASCTAPAAVGCGSLHACSWRVTAGACCVCPVTHAEAGACCVPCCVC